jgi:hypothetical protein
MGAGQIRNPYFYSQSGSTFVPIASPTAFIQIAVGGGNQVLAQQDAVWALDSAHNIYSYNGGFVQVSGALSQIAVGVGYQDSCHPYEVWGIKNKEIPCNFPC